MFSRRYQKGGFMAVMMVELAAVIALFMWAAMKMGYYGLQVHKSEDAADSVALAMMHIVNIDGLDALDDCESHPVVQRLVNYNILPGTAADIACPRAVYLDSEGNPCDPEPDPAANNCDADPEPIRRGEECFLVLVADGNALLQMEYNRDGARNPSAQDQNYQVTGGAHVMEERHACVTLQIPELMLVMDFSGSMNRNFEPGRSRLAVLRDAVRQLLERNLDVYYGSVIFNSDIEDIIAIQELNMSAPINNSMNNHNARRGTLYSRALAAAGGQYMEEDTGHYVLFITDGTPEDPGQALAAAHRLHEQEVTIYTLNVVNPGEEAQGGVAGDVGDDTYAARRELLIEMAGNKGNPGNDRYYFEAANPQELINAFAQVVASITCTVDMKMEFIPPGLDPWELKIFIQLLGLDDEIPLEYVNDLSSVPSDSYAYQYSHVDRQMRLSEGACRLVKRGDAELRIRVPPNALGPGMGSSSGNFDD